MPRKLTQAQVAQYQRDGFCFPIPVFPLADVIDLRTQLETFESRQANRPLYECGRVLVFRKLRVGNEQDVVAQGVVGPFVWHYEAGVRQNPLCVAGQLLIGVVATECQPMQHFETLFELTAFD